MTETKDNNNNNLSNSTALNSFDSGKIAALANSNKTKEEKKGILSKEKCFMVIENTRKRKELPDKETAMALITGLVQNGGSNKSAGNTSYERGNKILNSNELQQIITDVEKNATIRQFARTMANDIAEFAIIMEEEGDLAKQMRINHSDLSLIDLAWCSNFQTKNPNCPKKVRNWLAENYSKRFRN